MNNTQYDNSIAGFLAGKGEPERQAAFERGCERADEDNGVYNFLGVCNHDNILH